MPPKAICTAVLFSPAMVLVVWAVVIAAGDGYLTENTMVLFLIILAISVAAAETVRVRLRRALRKERRRGRE